MNEELVKELVGLGTATLYEASGLDCVLDPGLRPAWRGAAVAGPALPVRLHPFDNLALHRAVEQAQPGDVLVADAGGTIAGYWGEVLATAAQARAIQGLVIDGGVRDVDALERRRFPVFSRGIGLHRTGKHWPGTVGDTITVAGVPVAHGSIVVADTDGVITIPAESLDATLEAARTREAKEAVYMEKLAAGELTMDLLGLR